MTSFYRENYRYLGLRTSTPLSDIKLCLNSVDLLSARLSFALIMDVNDLLSPSGVGWVIVIGSTTIIPINTNPKLMKPNTTEAIGVKLPER